MNPLSKNSGIWQWSMFGFVLAGCTGFLFRLGMVQGLPYGLSFENIRHAHSHLMFFVWASLLPLYLIKLGLASGYHANLGARLMRVALWWVAIFGFLSYPAFVLYGYHPVPLGSATIPLAAILSGMVMIGWYIFMAGYLVTKSHKKNFEANPWFEGALLMLFISSLGAWGVGAIQFFSFGNPLFMKSLTHFFLAVFTEGWVLLVLIGLISKALNLKEEDYVVSPLILIGVISIGAPLTFPYGISGSMLSLQLSVAARIGGILIAEGVLLFVYSMMKARKNQLSLWIWPLLFLALKSVMQIIASVSPSDLWVSDHGIRILYLHVALLGAFTTGITCYLRGIANLKPAYFYGVLISVIIVILTLVLMTHLWPISLKGNWMYDALMLGTLFPIAAMTAFWIRLKRAVDREHYTATHGR